MHDDMSDIDLLIYDQIDHKHILCCWLIILHIIMEEKDYNKMSRNEYNFQVLTLLHSIGLSLRLFILKCLFSSFREFWIY